MKAVLLAAGLGTRMGEITRKTPKCLLPVAGRPLLGRWFEQLARAGVAEVLVNTHHLPSQVRDYLAAERPPLPVHLVHEPALLGSAGTLAENRAWLAGEPCFLVVYADNASTVALRELVGEHRANAVATLGLFRVPDPERRGVVEVDAAGTVTGFVEKPAHPRSNLAWAGLLVGTPGLLDAVPPQRPCDLGHHVLPRLLGRMRGVAIRGYHADVGTPEAWRATCADFERMESAA
jgi:mannose-1-phosphate guanylyltransferase